MHLVAIAWIYVVLMMAVAEALSTQGTVLGAFFTLLLYGVLPLTIVLYILAAPSRRRARLAHEAAADAAALAATAVGAAQPASLAPDGGRHAAGDAVSPERKEG